MEDRDIVFERFLAMVSYWIYRSQRIQHTIDSKYKEMYELSLTMDELYDIVLCKIGGEALFKAPPMLLEGMKNKGVTSSSDLPLLLDGEDFVNRCARKILQKESVLI